MIKNVILDTDLGSDVDDVGAVALANIFHNQKRINLLAVTHTTSGQYGPIICESINEYYGNSDIEVGVYKGPCFMKDELPDSYPEATFRAFPHKHDDPSQLPDSIEILRKKLSENEHVTLIFIGQLLNLANLMKSKADKYSNMSGEELINKKVDAVYIMGGKFPSITGLPIDDLPEYNLLTAIDSSLYAIKRLKVKTVFIDGSLGLAVNTGARISEKYKDEHIVSYAYRRYIYRNQDNSRASWDPITVYRGCIDDDLFIDVGPGFVNLDEQAKTSFVKDEKGNFFVTKLNRTVEEVQDKLEQLLVEGK